MVRKIVLGIITVTAILAMGATSFAEIKKTPSTKQQTAPALQTAPEAAAEALRIHTNATIHGFIRMDHGPTSFADQSCSTIEVKVRRGDETLLITRATGTYIGNGCYYSVNVRKGAGTVVSANFPVSLYPLTPKPKLISGYQGPFDLNDDITNLVIVMSIQW